MDPQQLKEFNLAAQANESFTAAIQRLEVTTREIQQRTIRTESRLVNLGDHMGLNLREQPKACVQKMGHLTVLTITAIDISLSAIVMAARKAELTGWVIVMHAGCTVAKVLIE